MCEENAFVMPEVDEELQEMLDNQTAAWDEEKEKIANSATDNQEFELPRQCEGQFVCSIAGVRAASTVCVYPVCKRCAGV